MVPCTEKMPVLLEEAEAVEQCLPPAYASLSLRYPGNGRLLKIGVIVLIAGALLLLFGCTAAFYFWKVNDQHVYNVHYMMSINGKVQEGSMEIDAGRNLETFKTGSGSEETVEVHDFQIGITGIRFSGGEKCFIKAQSKAKIPDVGSMIKETVSINLEDEIMPARFDENSLLWVAADQSIKDHSFLSSKILDLCGDLPIFWVRQTHPKENQRKKREVEKKHHPTLYHNSMNQFEAAAEEANSNKHSERILAYPLAQSSNETSPSFNPENPYHQMESEGGATNFDVMLDHQGICCIECRRSYTHCQRICEPLHGYEPWPYNYQGCRSACRVIMPCSWWVARILGIV